MPGFGMARKPCASGAGARKMGASASTLVKAAAMP
jgi:hypothetical protein